MWRGGGRGFWVKGTATQRPWGNVCFTDHPHWSTAEWARGALEGDGFRERDPDHIKALTETKASVKWEETRAL